MPLQLSQVHYSQPTKTATTSDSVTADQAKKQLVEMAVSLVSHGSPKSGFLRLTLRENKPQLAHGRLGSGYTAAGTLVTDLVRKAYGQDAAVVTQFEQYLKARGKVGVKSFLQLVGHLEPQTLNANPELNRLNLQAMGGRLKLILAKDTVQVPVRADSGEPTQHAPIQNAPIQNAPIQNAPAPNAPAQSAPGPKAQAQPELEPWKPSNQLALNKTHLQTPGVLCPPNSVQSGAHALHTRAFAALQKKGISFGVPGKAAGDGIKAGHITIDGKPYRFGAKAAIGKGSGAGIWMIALEDTGAKGSKSEFVIKANPQKGQPGSDEQLAEYFDGLRQKDLGEVQVLDLMSGNPHALQFHGAYSMPDGTLIYGMEKAAGDMRAVADARMESAQAGSLAPRAQDAHILQMAQALADMHGCGQVHGDVKSDNFMLGADGKVRIADFGESHVTRESQQQENLKGDVQRFAAMAYLLRYGIEKGADQLASTLESHQSKLSPSVQPQLSTAIRSHQSLLGNLRAVPNADTEMIRTLESRLDRLQDPATAVQTLMDISGNELDDSVRSYAINQLLLQAARATAPDFGYMADLSQRLGRLMQATSGATQPQAEVPAKMDAARGPAQQRDISGMEVLADIKGVKKLQSGQQISWFKPSSRLINSSSKCIGTGIIDRSIADVATEAMARLPERQVAASMIAKLLVPHIAVSAELAKDASGSGVLLENAEGIPASEMIDYASDPISMHKPVYDRVKSQLSDLQAFDYLIGNVDRHVENYLIDGSTVRAIDNGLSFPTVGVSELAGIADSKFGGLPKGYTQELRTGLAKLSPEQLAQDIRPLVGDEAYAQFLDRLERLRQDVASAGKAMAPAEPSSPFLTQI